MLDFIVLGQVPGTEFYVSFEYVAGALLAIFLIICLYKLVSPFKYYKRRMQKILDTTI